MDETLKALGINLNGLKYDELNAAERETLHQWLDQVQKKEITVNDIREYIHKLRDNIEQEFTNWNLKKEQELFLRARLKNIMLIESFLLGPERAKKALEQAIKGVNKNG